MAKIQKHTLFLETDYDYDMIGICSHHSDYRLVWGINELFRLHLAKADDLFEVSLKKNEKSRHSYYFQYDEENLLDIYLIKNKGDGKFLIPEKQQIDYFLFLKNNATFEMEEWLLKLKNHPSILAAFLFDPTTLDSTENLSF